MVDKIIFMFAGLMIGAAAALVGISPRLAVAGAGQAEDARRLIAFVEQLEPADRERFFSSTCSKERWAAIEALARVK